MREGLPCDERKRCWSGWGRLSGSFGKIGLMLERIGTTDAIDVLKMVAEERTELPTTVAAKGTLKRLGEKK